MVTLFYDMMHKEIEVYVDDMLAKSGNATNCLVDLRKLFKHLIKYRLRLNPNKCVFGASSGKLLGFIVSQKGIVGYANTVKREIDSQLHRQSQLHSLLHSAIDHHM